MHTQEALDFGVVIKLIEDDNTFPPACKYEGTRRFHPKVSVRAGQIEDYKGITGQDFPQSDQLVICHLLKLKPNLPSLRSHHFE